MARFARDGFNWRELGEVPSLARVSRALQGRFVMEDWHNFGSDYDLTLMAWHRNFTGHWSGLRDRFDPRFYRMWTYYLLSCAGAFRSRNLQLWQIVLTRHGLKGGLPFRDLPRPSPLEYPGTDPGGRP